MIFSKYLSVGNIKRKRTWIQVGYKRWNNHKITNNTYLDQRQAISKQTYQLLRNPPWQRYPLQLLHLQSWSYYCCCCLDEQYYHYSTHCCWYSNYFHANDSIIIPFRLAHTIALLLRVFLLVDDALHLLLFLLHCILQITVAVVRLL